ncbi:MAG: type II secretion system F family protein, partial [Selenomonadaceae bacterium]|nr:type II secretion system F family protein [Selenomonadaceae bacterium]
TLPVFDAFYKNHGAQLPKLTAILFSGGKFLAEHWILILGIFFAAIILIITIYREVDEVKFFVDKQKLNVRILREITLRNLFGRLSFLIENGITMDEALRLSMLSDENLYLKEMLRGAKISITKGVTLDKILRQVIKKISPLYVGLLSTGEATGEVVEMLRQCETIADAEIDEILRDLPTKAELYGTILAGLIVAALVFSIMLPILNMSTLNF